MSNVLKIDPETGLVNVEELEQTLQLLHALEPHARTEEVRMLIISNISIIEHLIWCYGHIKDLKQREYTLECMLHAEGKIPYDPDKVH